MKMGFTLYYIIGNHFKLFFYLEKNLFVSIGKDRTLRVFDYEEKVHVKTYNMPKNVGSSKYITQSKCFYCILWLDESKIISTFPR